MTASNVAATQAVAYAFIDKRFPWLPKPKIIEWDNTAGGASYYATDKSISVPKYSDAWNDGRPDIVVHEVGHVVVFYCSQFGEVLTPFLAAMGADPALRQHPLINEIIAEHFARAYVPGYDGHNRPQLVGLAPFNAEETRTFFQSLRNTPAVERPLPVAVAPRVVVAPEWFGPIPGGNFMQGRDGTLIDRIVLHHMDGTIASTDAWFKNPAVVRSTHFGIGLDGNIVQWVSTGDTAYANGLWSMNLRAISIEFEDRAQDEGSGPSPFTEAQYRSGSKLVSDLCLSHGIPKNRDHVIGHRQVIATACPGSLDVDRIATGGTDLAFKDDPDAQSFAADVKASLDAIKAVLATQAHHKHKAETSEPEAA